jgi:hypothetical protein
MIDPKARRDLIDPAGRDRQMRIGIGRGDPDPI